MVDFKTKAVHQYWSNYPDPTLYKVVAFMEGVEDWTLDGDPEIEKVIDLLGKTLDDIGNIELKQEDTFIELISHIKTGRGLRILMALDQAYPGAASKIISHAEKQPDSDTAQIFIRRNLVFERLRLLSRIFAPDRCELIVKTLEEGSHE